MTTFKLLAGMALICTLSLFTSCSESDLEPVVENDIETILSNANKIGAPILAKFRGQNNDDAVVSYRSECHEFVKAKGFGTLAYNCGYAPNVRFSLTVRNAYSGSGLIQQGSDKIWFRVTYADGGYRGGDKGGPALASNMRRTPPKYVSGYGYVTRINNQRFSAGDIPIEFYSDDYPGFGYYFGDEDSDCGSCESLASFATSGNCGAELTSGRMNISIRDLDCADDDISETI